MSRPPNGYRSGSNPNNTQMSRAERFEDEKRRIIESCFSKTDANGQLAESYITHIRIQEDAQHPSTPAPPGGDPANTKPRLIIVAVRSTGRVRMHKARENNNGSFSIGKTWNLEDLSCIETFSGNAMPPPATERDAQYREWAGQTGFTVTITKPYYWQAGTAKEKDFFIASCVKIYRKYTKGLVPELRGFGEQDKAMMLGQPAPSQQATAAQDQRRPSGGSPAPVGAAPPLNQPRPPFAQDGSRSREGSRTRSPAPPPSYMNAERQTSASPGPPALRSPRGPPSAGFGQPLGAPRPFAGPGHVRSGSGGTRESTPSSLNAGISPAPPPTRQGPSEQSSQTQLRQSSPGRSSQTSSEVPPMMGREAVGTGQMRGYQREKAAESIQDSSNAHGFDPSVSSPATAGAFHSAMFGQTRQRSFQSQAPLLQQPQQPHPMSSQEPRWQPEQTSTTGAPLLPPILTDQPKAESQSPHTANTAKESEASSAGIDLSDAAAISALTGFWGPEHQAPTPQLPTPQFTPKPAEPPRIEEPASPPTPERSKRRPPFQETRSTDSVDLRPPPLGAASRSRTPNDDASRYNTPLDGRSGVPSPHGMGSPAHEEPPAVRPQPLFGRQQSDTSASNLHLPGAFASPIGSSPAGTPKEEATKTLSPQRRPQSPPERVRAVSPPVEAVKIGESSNDVKPPEAVPAATTPDIESPEDQYRPGLGPMIKKKGAAERFRSAARTANAFKPRPGGVAEKILQAKAERGANGEPGGDGISGVFKPTPKVEEVQKAPEESMLKERELRQSPPPPDLSVKPPVVRTAPPKVEVSSPTSPKRGRDEALAALHGTSRDGSQLSDTADGLRIESQSDVRDSDDDRLEQRELREPRAKVKRRSFKQEQYITELGIDRSLLEGRGLDFEVLLTDFGWSTSSLKPKQIGELEADIKREVGRVEAGAWLSHTDSAREERVAQVERLLDKAIAECDELEGLLTLYSVELGSLNEDIAYIEAQSQGLQVQSANQKLLHTELQSLVDTMSLDRRTLEPLRYSDLTDERSIENVESSLVKLYQAMVTIDPSIRSGHSTDGRPRSRGGVDADSELSRMKALREKRDVYERECTQFCQRLMQQLDYHFTTVLNNAKDRVYRPMSGGPATTLTNTQKKIDKQAFASMRSSLWVYSPLILFSKEVNLPAWQTMLRLYYQPAHSLYDSTFKDNIAGLKRSARKPTGEEGDILFTAQEKDSGDAGSGSALSSTARKMTVKRSQTLAKGLRQASGDKRSVAERLSGSMPCEVFANAIDEMAPLISQEQNFVVDLFHATSLETADFLDVVSAYPPHERRGTNLLAGRHVEPDRDMARRITNTMEEIFGFFATEVTILLDWALTGDPIQGVGIMASLSKHSYYLQAQNQSQEWLISMIEAHSARLQTQFSKFIEEQVHAIEDTKVKIKKRKGVIAFMKIFPPFSAAIENTFAAVAGHDYDVNHDCIGDVRRLVDDAYNRINRAMFDSLKVIAKESPLQQAPGAQKSVGQSDDPEDKEMLNYQILIIENMNHYLEDVDGSYGGVLAEWRDRAERERKEALDAYISRVIRRPLGKLLDYLDATDAFLVNSRGGDAPLAQRQNYSRKAARHLLSQYDGKEVRRGIETLRRRIEKHFGDADEPEISRGLVAFVCKQCEATYEDTLLRVERLIREVYPPMEGEKAVEVDFNRGDVQAGFRK